MAQRSKRFLNRITAAVFTVGSVVLPATCANALDWLITQDPASDSYDINGTGIYEIFKGGFAQDNEFVYFGLDTNLPITGNNTGPSLGGFPVSNGNIGWGDLFLDFSPETSFKQSLDAGAMYGVKFAPGNDSGVASTGVYAGITATNVSQTNAGFWNLTSQNIAVNGQSLLGNISPNDPYYAGVSETGTFTPNVISSGSYVGEITTLTGQELFDLQFPALAGTTAFGFKVPKSLLPSGNAIMSLWQECMNEGFAMPVSITPIVELPEDQDVPEPLSTAALGLFVGGCILVTRRKQSSNLSSM